MTDPTSYCTFRLGEAEFALDAADVQEVLRDCDWSPVPLAASSVLGLMNLRGQIVTVVDLAKHLGLAPGASPAGARVPRVNIVLSGARPPLSFAVDEVGDVVALPASSLQSPPANLDERSRKRVRAVHLDGGRLISVLETCAVLEGFGQADS
jgi:purine-binding chemotaxis protein CheW